MIWKINNHDLHLTRKARIMGILNVTPDSFSDGGNFARVESALAQAGRMIAEGATIIDVGGESTRPGSQPVDQEVEIRRAIPVIKAIRAEWSGLISIDTMKAPVAEAALAAGADIINDVSGLTHDPEMINLCVESHCGIVVMHMLGTPANMQNAPLYSDVTAHLRGFFQERLDCLVAAGIQKERICFDPGIGFGKTLDHNLAILKNIAHLSPIGSPLLLGVSRKSLISKIIDCESPTERDAATLAMTTLARRSGVMLHRVHAVKENLHALRITEALI
ncbi:dihydropteroate synthase [Luteolibacter algae]|uniref:Dihydropteroate synthase n=1 Tax=Luteolibacter algae TaxID=454151 RepID=A0ABW5DCR6_9BACT